MTTSLNKIPQSVRTEHVLLAAELARHARSEEEVLYPAAVLVGELVRGRLADRK